MRRKMERRASRRVSRDWLRWLWHLEDTAELHLEMVVTGSESMKFHGPSKKSCQDLAAKILHNLN